MDHLVAADHTSNERPIEQISQPLIVEPLDCSPSIPSTITLTVVVVKDDKGYGMKVSGDNPVFVQSVKQSGAAEKAGLHSGDKIVKVNGINVTHSTHTEVVELIKSSTQVELTVQQRPLFINSSNPNTTLAPMNSSIMNLTSVSPTPVSSPVASSRPLHHHHSAPARDRITGPQPVDVEQMRHVELERWHTFKLMLEKEQRYVETLKKDLQKSTEMSSSDNYKLKRELSGAERRVKTLQDQLTTFKQIPLCNIAQVSEFDPPPLPPRNAPPLPPRNPTLTNDKLPNNLLNTGVNISRTDSPNLSLCHQRTKSNPDKLSEGKSLGNKKISLSESFNDLHLVKHSKGGLSWELKPSPRHSPNRSDAANQCDESNIELVKHGSDRYSVDSTDIKLTQSPIISMEDDEISDQEFNQQEEHGPFKSFTKLVEHNAHLAVFLNYVISNSDPSALLFYLVTNLFKEGNAKEMKKWAYEIHSSFLVPCAPLRLTNVEDNLVREIDDTLQRDSDREEILRKVFWKARTKAKEELNEQLSDFRHRRTAGLGTLFGPPDSQLNDSINDKLKELRIIEMILVPNIEPFIEDMEKETFDDRRFTMAAALTTVMSKIFGIRGTHSNSLMDRCPTFVSKEKSLKAKLIGKCRKFNTKGHNFVVHQYFTVTYCNHCQLIIWGIGPQGYQCTNCLLNIHRACVKILDENCPGPIVNKKDKANNHISKLMDRIRPERGDTRKKPGSNFIQIEKSKRQSEDSGDTIINLPEKESDRTNICGSNIHFKTMEDSFKSDRGDMNTSEMLICSKLKTPGISINRSESYKERIHQKRQIRERRKTSDPNLPSKYKNDVEQEIQISFARSDSSSNSNLSTKSLDSRSTSLEVIGHGGEVTSCLDSDSENEFDLSDWASNVPPEILEQLSSKEKKRQEVINELYHTERSHIRGLKVLEYVFHRPMRELQVLPPDQLQLLFANLEQMIELHLQFCNAIKAVRKDNHVVQNIGQVLLSTFDGNAGEIFQKAAATFCARQQIALESLKEKRKKDPKLNIFLNEAEANSVCKRLQLKDILPTGMIRLTKYPLLFESLVKCSTNEEELSNINRSFERSKIILNFVNQTVREAEDGLRLSDIQKKLDATPFEKVDHTLSVEYKNLDVTKHKLIHEGGLWLRIGGTRQKMIELHVLLLEDLIILLNKVDDKYVLKYYGFQDRTPTLSPIIKMSTALVRHNAVDKKAMFLVNTSQAGAQIYDLVTTSSNERKTWFRHISEASEAYKVRESKIKKQEHIIDYEDIIQGTKKNSVIDNCVEPSNNNNNNSLNSSQLSTSLDSSNFDIFKRGNDETFVNNETLNITNNTPVLSKTQKSPLIEPSEVLVSQSSVLKAEPVITHLEKLRRNNKIIEEALNERLQLVADILKMPLSNSTNTSESSDGADNDPNKILLSAVSQGNEIITVLNESLNMTDVDTIALSLGTSNLNSNCSLYKAYAAQLSRITKVKPIVTSLNSQITELLISTSKHDKQELEMRKELQTYRERLHAFQEKSLAITENNGTENNIEHLSTIKDSEANGSSLEI